MIQHRSPRGEGERLRDRIVEQAERLLLTHGDDDAVGIREVADAVGVTPPSIYRHFANKDELILAVCNRQFAAFDEVTASAIAGTSDPLDELRARGEAYIRFGSTHPEAYRVMFMRPPRVMTNRAEDEPPEAFLSLMGAVRRAMAAGALKPGDPAHVAAAIWASVHGLTSLLITKPGFERCFTDEASMFDDVLHGAVAPFLAGD